MPAKTDVKKKVLILGTGPDAEEARQIADSHADVTVSTRFTANVTHLVVDETVKQSEPRLKRASSESVPVLRLAAFKELLGAADAKGEGKDAAEDTSVPQQADAPAVEQDKAVDEASADEAETKDDAPAEEKAKTESPSDQVEDSSDTVEKGTSDNDGAEEEATEAVAETTVDEPVKAESKKAESKKAESENEEESAGGGDKASDDDGDEASAKAVDESKPVGGTKTEAAPKVGFLAKLKALFGKK